MAKNYTTRTAALKATTADIRKLNIDGSPFSKVVSDNVPETPTENDIWKYAAATDDNGVVTINTDVTCDYSEITDAQKDILKTTVKVIDNKVLDANDTLLMNWDTKNFTNDNNTKLLPIFGGSYFPKSPLTTFTSDLSSLTNGSLMFAFTSLASFTSNLSSLTNGSYMFYYTPLSSFTTDLPSLTNGSYMFYNTSLESFTSNLSSLIDGTNMFGLCTSLASFTSDLPSLTNGMGMFGYCSSLKSFTSNLSSLTNGDRMFVYTSLESFTSDLSSLTNGYKMFYGTSLASFSSDLSSLIDGYHMFERTTLASFTSDLPSLTNGELMFYGTSLASFNSTLPSLTKGSEMFKYCKSLTSFNSSLSNLTYGGAMFSNCTALTSFNSSLSNLAYGYGMFYNCTSLKSFTSDLPSLTDGSNMFAYTSLASFTSDLPSLTNGYGMFRYTSLASFTSDLSSLVRGDSMFYNCKLDAQSVMFIIESIRDIVTEKASLTDDDYVTYENENRVYSKPFGWMSDGRYVYTYNDPQPYTTTISASNVGKLTIGINVTNDSSTIDTQLEEFAKDADYDSWADLKQAFADKGWTVTWQYGGTETSITLSADEEFRGVPVWAKIEEVIPVGETYTEEEIANALYCTEDGSKYYNISWGHDVNDEAKDETMTDESKYFYFGSLLEACGYFGVIPKEYLEA